MTINGISRVLNFANGQKILEIAKVIPLKYTVIIMSHNFTKNRETSDIEICSLLYNQVKVFRDVELVDKPFTADVCKGILSDASGVISSRYHAAVGALTSGVPTLTIGWNSKYDELMRFMRFRLVRPWDTRYCISTCSICFVGGCSGMFWGYL